MRRNIIKRLTCIVITVLMVVSLLPASAFAATSYRYLYVNGKNIITAANKTVQCGNGTATFDADSNILTLENATIDVAKTSAISSSNYYGIYIRPTSTLTSGVTINLIGDNVITGIGASDYGIYIYSNTDVNITSSDGTGTLTIDNAYRGIWCAGSGTSYPSSISSCTVTIGATYYGIYVNAPFSVTNANVSVSVDATGSSRGIAGSSNLIVDISDGSVVDISCTGTASCALYATKYASTGTYDPATVTVTDSSLTCTVSDDSTNAAIYASGIAVDGNSSLIADGGVNFRASSSYISSFILLDPASDSSLTIYGGSSAGDAELFADSYTSATTIDIDHQTNSTLDYSYGYLYLKIVSGEPVSMKSGNSSYRFIYVNEEYHALIIERNSRRFLISIPHDVGSDGYCTVCKEYIGGGEVEEPEIVEMDESQYTVTYSMDIDSNSGDWEQWNLGDKELLEALSAEGALLQIVRGEEVDSTSVGEEDYEKFVLVDSWYSSNDYVWLGTGGDTSDDEPNVIDCLSDDGITITYDGNTIYDAWMANCLDDGGVAVLVSNCSFTYAVSSIRVIVPAE